MGRPRRHEGGPARTCVGCRQVKAKGDLVRLGRLADGVIVVDPRARAGGRGAYVCAEVTCVERALGRGQLARAFRARCEASPGLVEDVRAAAPSRGEASGEMDRNGRAAAPSRGEASGEVDR